MDQSWDRSGPTTAEPPWAWDCSLACGLPPYQEVADRAPPSRFAFSLAVLVPGPRLSWVSWEKRLSLL